jgi:hypothetical protein
MKGGDFAIEAVKVKWSGTLVSAGDGKKLRILGWIFISNVRIMKTFFFVIDGGLRFCRNLEGKFGKGTWDALYCKRGVQFTDRALLYLYVWPIW